MYDVRCEALAELFLEDTCGKGDKEAIAHLAQHIQDQIEEWIEFDLKNEGCAQ